eukprot:3149181-Prymnesium_polylepis.1
MVASGATVFEVMGLSKSNDLVSTGMVTPSGRGRGETGGGGASHAGATAQLSVSVGAAASSAAFLAAIFAYHFS